jgi:hypothetical protein
MARVNGSPTTTRYAILGQLAWGEATTYELMKAMGRNLSLSSKPRGADELRRFR